MIEGRRFDRIKKITPYYVDSEQFKADMESLANDLEAAGY